MTLRAHEEVHRPGVAKGESPYAKDHAVAGTIMAAAGIAWFVWGHVGERLTTVLGLGMIAGILLTVGGGVVTRSLPGISTMATDPKARHIYWSAMAAQSVAIVAGFVLLGSSGAADYLPAWVLAVVGFHFLPLARAFGSQVLSAAGWACVAVAVLAVGSGSVGWLPAPTVAGGGGGLVLLVSAVLSLREARRG